jgi:deoxyribonucleoside regulator
MESVIEIEEKIKSLFPIKHVFICPAYIDDYIVRINDTCKVAAQDISKLVQDNEIIGVSWGRTMDSVASYLIPPNPPKRNIKIVQMHGALIKNIASSKFNSIVEKFADAFLGTDYLLPAPVFVDTKEIADAIMSDSNIRMIFDIMKESDLAVFGIGEVSATSKLIERGIYTEEQYNAMEHDGVVGDICSRYYDIYGNPVLPDLLDRTIAIKAEDLKKKKHRIGIGVGENKTKAIIGGLNSGLMTALYTDEITARDVLRQYETLHL